ncbi:uncharacterized protein LOC113357687 isoform X2 [Papaver somniferum]|uniref:uncharacterized protein LOC113357687 isoform X2 n=1 Tax=Papaver somniferum TaxID=3469 RepID=UPI000E6F6EEF|nr:uncharacterized protein LOC113357687 isoform X2 [Papaver somniferum]
MEGSESSAKDDGGGLKGKSCKGCLYYSSIRKSKSRNPLCLGITGALQQVPESTVGGSDTDASKDARNLTEFKYACVGYSVHSHSKDHSADSKDKRAELPFCVGVELLLDKKPAAAEQVSGHVHNKEGSENYLDFFYMIMVFLSHGHTSQRNHHIQQLKNY